MERSIPENCTLWRDPDKGMVCYVGRSPCFITFVNTLPKVVRYHTIVSQISFSPFSTALPIAPRISRPCTAWSRPNLITTVYKMTCNIGRRTHGKRRSIFWATNEWPCPQRESAVLALLGALASNTTTISFCIQTAVLNTEKERALVEALCKSTSLQSDYLTELFQTSGQ